jgi:hypothetical protein
MKRNNHLGILEQYTELELLLKSYRDCGEIEGGAAYNCLVPLQGGADPNVTLINFPHWTGEAVDVDTPNLITAFTLANNKSGYKYEGFGRSVSPQQEVIKAGGSGQNLYKHQVGIFIFSRTQLQKNEIQRLALGRFIAIVRSRSRDANGLEIYGLNNGLELMPGVIQQLNENNGAYNLVLATPENQFESKLPQTFYDGTSFASSLATVENTWYAPAILNLTDLSLSTAGGDAVIVTGKNFYGSGAASDIVSIKWVNQNTLAEVTQTSPTVSSTTTLNFSSVALTAGTYKLKITTSKGVAYSTVNVVAA